ncbi:hypothetical protein BpHYR1_053243 [Brachionus plicatilis]|uniref:Uncharacterized protein n=1 Tax=Brachionus plicatilis TaxID=10195 RepID=A0A3M7SGY3_BRAPC|nr:hypothetical protein BpHYR1_053243 [Brachionus plicatilis]
MDDRPECLPLSGRGQKDKPTDGWCLLPNFHSEPKKAFPFLPLHYNNSRKFGMKIKTKPKTIF